MRNQIGWIVLSAFFCGASAIAQEPASSTLSFRDVGWSEPSGNSSGDSSHINLGDAPTFGTRIIQDDEGPYGLRSLFRQHHGEFIDRYKRYDPALELRARLMPNQTIKSESGTFDLLQYDLDFETATVVTTEAYLVFGIYQNGRRYKMSSAFANASNLDDETITAAGVRLGIGWFVDNNILVELETNPGVYSDLEDSLGHKDYDFPTSALVTYRGAETFFFKFGLRYNQIYEDAPWLPYLGFRWELTPSFRIDVLAPEFLELSYTTDDGDVYAWGTEVRGAEYRVHSSLDTGKQGADLHVQEVVTYLGLTHRFTDQTSLQVRGGLVLAGDYDWTNGEAGFQYADGALSQGFYADITLGLDW